jgi:hypothetical protein
MGMQDTGTKGSIVHENVTPAYTVKFILHSIFRTNRIGQDLFVDVFLNDTNWTMFPDRQSQIFSNQISYTKKLDSVWRAYQASEKDRRFSECAGFRTHQLKAVPGGVQWQYIVSFVAGLHVMFYIPNVLHFLT